MVLGLCIKQVFADGFIVVPPPHPVPGVTPVQRAFPLEVKFHKVDVEINEMSATTYIDQEFYNPTSQRLEGYYMFPIPKGAVINKFSMFINGKETEAELLDAKKAQQVYEDIVRRMIDPALLEYYQQGLFKARIFPIEPNSTKRVKISYNQILQKDNMTIEYLYPLNTEKFSSKPLADVAIKVTIQSQHSIKNIYSPTHEIDIVRKDAHNAVLSYEEHTVKPDKDFSLFYNTDEAKIGFSMLTYKEAGEKKGFFFLDISPDLNVKADEIEEKDITFVLDVSGSMAGDKIKQAKKALLFCVENLNKGDRFEIIRFSTEAEALFNSMVEASDQNREKARKFIEGLRTVGGTNIQDALQLALQQKKSQTRPTTILFITDGKPTINEMNEDRLVELVKKGIDDKAKIFTFGIGADLNTHLLDKITTTTNAYRTYITEQEDIEVKISNLYSKIQSPVLTNIKLRTGGTVNVSEMQPSSMPDLFKGSSVTVLGRYSGSGIEKMTLEGVLKGKTVTFEYTVNFSKQDEKNSFIPPLWAARKIAFLLDQIRLNGEEKELVDEVVELARKYGIITPYTSYLIVEDEAQQVEDRRMRQDETVMQQFAPRSSEVYEESKREYDALKQKSGAPSVSASRKVQSLNMAKNIDKDMAIAMPRGKGTSGYTTQSQQLKNIQGRAVYNNGSFWLDSYVPKKKYAKTVQIKYASEAYFKLLNEKPQTGEFLALGRNVRFVFDTVLYEVQE